LGLANHPENFNGEPTGLFGASLLLLCATANVVVLVLLLPNENVNASEAGGGSLSATGADAELPNEIADDEILLLSVSSFEVVDGASLVAVAPAVSPNEKVDADPVVGLLTLKVLKGLSDFGSFEVTLG
jgi:hypothetical protein